jgi:hypothetical protein
MNLWLRAPLGGGKLETLGGLGDRVNSLGEELLARVPVEWTGPVLINRLGDKTAGKHRPARALGDDKSSEGRKPTILREQDPRDALSRCDSRFRVVDLGLELAPEPPDDLPDAVPIRAGRLGPRELEPRVGVGSTSRLGSDE